MQNLSSVIVFYCILLQIEIIITSTIESRQLQSIDSSRKIINSQSNFAQSVPHRSSTLSFTLNESKSNVNKMQVMAKSDDVQESKLRHMNKRDGKNVC